MADMAGFPELRTGIDSWDELDPIDQSRMLYGLRGMLQACPACDDPIVGGEQRVKSCCRSFDVLALRCGDCDARLFEVVLPNSQ